MTIRIEEVANHRRMLVDQKMGDNANGESKDNPISDRDLDMDNSKYFC